MICEGVGLGWETLSLAKSLPGGLGTSTEDHRRSFALGSNHRINYVRTLLRRVAVTLVSGLSGKRFGLDRPSGAVRPVHRFRGELSGATAQAWSLSARATTPQDRPAEPPNSRERHAFWAGDYGSSQASRCRCTMLVRFLEACATGILTSVQENAAKGPIGTVGARRTDLIAPISCSCCHRPSRAGFQREALRASLPIAPTRWTSQPSSKSMRERRKATCHTLEDGGGGSTCVPDALEFAPPRAS